MGINNIEAENFITRIVHLFLKIRKVINKIESITIFFGMELELISCLLVGFFRVTSVNMERMSRDFTLFVLCCAVFFFFLVQVSLDGSTISSWAKDPMNSDVWGSLYKSVTCSLYVSSNFRLRTVAGIRSMTVHGISSPPCVIWEYRYCIDVNCASISVPVSSNYSVMWLISCGRWPTARGSWLEHVLIAKISNKFPLSW